MTNDRRRRKTILPATTDHFVAIEMVRRARADVAESGSGDTGATESPHGLSGTADEPGLTSALLRRAVRRHARVRLKVATRTRHSPDNRRYLRNPTR